MTNPSLVIQLQDLPRLLSFIRADDRDTWLKVGNGLKTEFGESAFSYWDAWGANADNYNAEDAKSVWRSLKSGNNTLGSVIFFAQAEGWKPDNTELTLEQKRQFKLEQEERRVERQKTVEADAAKLERMQKVVAAACSKIWDGYCVLNGQSDYLKRKQVEAYDVRFINGTILHWVDDLAERAGVVSRNNVKEFFAKLPKPRPENLYFRRLSHGTLVVPLFATHGMLTSLQFITPDGDKKFPKYGKKSGSFCFLPNWEGFNNAPVVAIAEGYATAASIHKATGWPVVVAFDAGNIVPVADTVRDYFPYETIVICADKDEKRGGEKFAYQAAENIGARVVVPSFGEPLIDSCTSEINLARSL